MKTKPLPYTGVLNDPLIISVPWGLTTKKVPPMYLALGLAAESWPARLTASYIADWDMLLAKRRALFLHFKVNPEGPNAELDLALCLAYRHERDTLLDGECVRFGAVCALFETTDISALVWKIATKHVPGFQIEKVRSAARITTTEWVKVFFTVFVVADRLAQQGTKASDHQIAEIMLDHKKLRDFIPDKAARSVQSILERTGNKERGSARDLKSRNTFLRTKIREARRAWADLKSGKANNFQEQIVTEVWPLLHSLKA